MMAIWRVELKDETGFESQYYEDKVWKTYVSYGHGETAHSKAVEMVDTMNEHTRPVKEEANG